MSPTDITPLDPELVEVLEHERAHPDVSEAMKDRIRRGVELELMLIGGSGGGRGPSPDNDPADTTGGPTSTVVRNLGARIGSLFGGLLLAACIARGSKDPPQSDLVKEPTQVTTVIADPAPRAAVRGERSEVHAQAFQHEGSPIEPSSPGLDAGAPGLSGRSGGSGEAGPDALHAALDAGTADLAKQDGETQAAENGGSFAVLPLRTGSNHRISGGDSKIAAPADAGPPAPSAAPRLVAKRLALPSDLRRPTPYMASLLAAAPERSRPAAIYGVHGPGRPAARPDPGEGLPVSNDDIGGALALGSGRSIAVDLEGNTIVAGWFTESIDLGDGPVESKGRSDIFLLKLDASGKRLWSKTLGGDGADRALGVAVNCDLQIIVTGWFMDDVDLESGILANAGGKDAFVAAFSPSGDGLWSEGFGDEEDQLGNSVQVDGENNVVITGAFGGTIDFGTGILESAGEDDVFVAKLDSNGEPRWGKRVGGAGDHIGAAVAVDGSGNVVLSDVFAGRLDSGAEPLKSKGELNLFVARILPR